MFISLETKCLFLRVFLQWHHYFWILNCVWGKKWTFRWCCMLKMIWKCLNSAWFALRLKCIPFTQYLISIGCFYLIDQIGIFIFLSFYVTVLYFFIFHVAFVVICFEPRRKTTCGLLILLLQAVFSSSLCCIHIVFSRWLVVISLCPQTWFISVADLRGI